jgi:molybdopterin-guanine dinucleotide biosynthesis protein MobB
MPPVVSIIGKSNSGKTILIERLVQELKSRNYRVATIKHIPHEINFDDPGKDSWRHIQAGSEATAVSSSDKIVLIKPVAQGVTVDEVATLKV